MSPEMLTDLFGWMTVLNFGLLVMAGLCILLMRDRIAALHASLAGITQAEAKRSYFAWLGSYKMLTLVFCLVPWIALRIVA